MDFQEIIVALLVGGSTLYIFIHFYKVLTRGAEKTSCANCALSKLKPVSENDKFRVKNILP